MKSHRILSQYSIPAALITMFIAGNAVAATTTSTFQVTATVVDACSVSATDLAFGNYDPVAATLIPATATVTATCSLGTSYAIALDDGSNSSDSTVSTRRMTDGSSNYLSYQIFKELGYLNVWGETASTDDVSGVGTGLAIPVTMYGRITAGQQTVPAGSYSDTVTVTVTY